VLFRSYLTYWDATSAGTVSLRFDLGAAKQIRYIGVNQREDSTTHPASNSARINGYRVYVSNDGSTWGSPIKTGNLPNHRGVQIIDVPATTARHVRLEKTSSHGIARLRVDEAWVGGQYAGGGPATGTRLEAEDATISQGVVESNHAGFSGSGFVNGDNVAGSYVEWTIPATADGTATIALRYANGTTANRPATIAVNGAAQTRDYAGTGAWTTWATDTFTVPLTAGSNTLRVTATTAGGNPNLDHVEVATGGLS
jgi:alpha-L-fucosidase